MSAGTRFTWLSERTRQEGFGATLAEVGRYVHWRLRGRPVAGDAYMQWIVAADAVRPSQPDPGAAFSVVMPVYNTDPGYLTRAVASVVAQTHTKWELVAVDDASTNSATSATLGRLARSDERIKAVRLEENLGIAGATNAGISAASFEWVVFMDHDDLLHPHALEWFSSVATRTDMIYSDEDKIDLEDRRYAPTRKPAWSPRLLLGNNYINHLTAIRTDILRSLDGIREGYDGAQDHDLMLRLAEVPDLRVAHIPNVLYHWRIWPGSFSQGSASSIASERSGVKAVAAAVERRGWNAEAGLGRGAPFNYRPRFRQAEPRPSAKVVIPTRDRVKMLRRCVSSVLHRTDGVDVHLVIVDNGSVKASTLEYLKDVSKRDNVTVCRVDDEFNFSLLCNTGAVAGPDTDYLVFLNNDVEIRGRRWLQQLTGWLMVDPDVCATGTKLYYQDGSIQHAGVVLGLGGVAGHYAESQPDGPVINQHHDQTREVTAVTGALLVVRADDFAAVAGFCEDLPLVYQDIDLCLRLTRETGGVVLYDPTYAATHVGSASRPKHEPAQIYGVSRFQMLWRDAIESGDLYYNPHFSLEYPDFTIAPISLDDDDLERRFRPRISGGKTDDPSK